MILIIVSSTPSLALILAGDFSLCFFFFFWDWKGKGYCCAACVLFVPLSEGTSLCLPSFFSFFVIPPSPPGPSQEYSSILGKGSTTELQAQIWRSFLSMISFNSRRLEFLCMCFRQRDEVVVLAFKPFWPLMYFSSILPVVLNIRAL